MKLVQLQIKDVLKIKAISLDINGEHVAVCGKNKQGKSSVLDSLAMLTGGATEIPDNPIRTGATRGSIVGVMDTGVTFERVITPKGSHLIVKGSDGEKMPGGPQGVLEKMCGKFFDPFNFPNKKPSEQATIIKERFGLNLDEIEAELNQLFDDRKIASAQAKQADAVAKGAPRFEDAPEQEASVAGLARELTDGNVINSENMISRNALATSESAVVSIGKDVDNLRASMVEMESLIAPAEESARKACKTEKDAVDVDTTAITMKMERLASELAAGNKVNKQNQEHRARAMKARAVAQGLKDRALLLGEDITRAKGRQDKGGIALEHERQSVGALTDIDIDAITKKMETAEITNEQVRANAAASKLDDEADAAEDKAKALTTKLDHRRKDREAMIAAADIPIKGLTLGDGEIKLNGQPFAQASGAEKVEVSVAIWTAANPGLKVLAVEGNALDDEARAAMFAQAKADGVQLFMELVGVPDVGDVQQIVIEDGEIKE